MATRPTVKRNTGTILTALKQGKSVRFTYTDQKGKAQRRTVKPVAFSTTPRHTDALLVQAVEGPMENFRSFRTDRVMRAVIVG